MWESESSTTLIALNAGIYNHEQKSWDKFALEELFHMRKNKQSRVNSTTLAQPLPPPPHLRCWTFPQSFITVWGWDARGGGGAETNFVKDNSAFSNSVFKTQIIHAMTQVSQRILSTIVYRRILVPICSTRRVELVDSWTLVQHLGHRFASVSLLLSSNLNYFFVGFNCWSHQPLYCKPRVDREFFLLKISSYHISL